MKGEESFPSKMKYHDLSMTWNTSAKPNMCVFFFSATKKHVKIFHCVFFSISFFQKKKWEFCLQPKQETPGNLSREDWVVVCAASDDSDALVNGEKAGRIAVREAANDKLPRKSPVIMVQWKNYIP